MSDPAFLLVVTTVGNADDAARLARTLVERGLAACAQISAIESYYAWQGAIEHDSELASCSRSRSAPTTPPNGRSATSTRTSCRRSTRSRSNVPGSRTATGSTRTRAPIA
jgi:hypothetical protein